MCGIIGYIGDKSVVPILVEGLKKLEYRGYDSAGIAVVDGVPMDVRLQNGSARRAPSHPDPVLEPVDVIVRYLDVVVGCTAI